jgi:hypothetical protein
LGRSELLRPIRDLPNNLAAVIHLNLRPEQYSEQQECHHNAKARMGKASEKRG